jgi:hypothetical protein
LRARRQWPSAPQTDRRSESWRKTNGPPRGLDDCRRVQSSTHHLRVRFMRCSCSCVSTKAIETAGGNDDSSACVRCYRRLHEANQGQKSHTTNGVKSKRSCRSSSRRVAPSPRHLQSRHKFSPQSRPEGHQAQWASCSCSSPMFSSLDEAAVSFSAHRAGTSGWRPTGIQPTTHAVEPEARPSTGRLWTRHPN